MLDFCPNIGEYHNVLMILNVDAGKYSPV